ncbi:MAG: FliI/YscN family ATPase, partial [bacterium]
MPENKTESENILTEAETKWDSNPPFRLLGRVSEASGVIVHSIGPRASVGDLCYIEQPDGERLEAEVVGFTDEYLQLMPVGEMQGISDRSRVIPTGESFKVRAGEQMLGRVVNGRGRPMDAGPPFTGGEPLPIYREPPSSLHRQQVDAPLPTGVRAIDGCLTLGKGQRIGIFSGSGVGKSTLLGMIARYTEAEINVVCLVGERRREVKDFIVKNLDSETKEKTVMVVATSDQPALLRIRCAFIATTIAEYFRDQGADVMLMMDSLTRVAWAQREIGLARDEPPARRGFPPSVFDLMPRLLERSGAGENGTITGIYSVLVEGDDLSEPIADTARGILDGHITLNRDLAERNHYPAIDVLESVSRVMIDVTGNAHQEAAGKLKEALAVYRDAEDLINIGAYEEGSNPQIDYALDHIEQINNFLRQGINESSDFEETVNTLQQIFA